MVARLLDRQISLLEYLTSSDAIFGADSPAFPDRALQGFDPGLLRLEASFSHEKRMEKIHAVFPHTFRLLGHARAEVVRNFTEAFPPIDISRVGNARQFHEFLCATWRSSPPAPPYMGDVAACEIAFAKARVQSGADELAPAGSRRPSRGAIRRHPGVVLLRCEYDVRPIFEAQGQDVVPIKRETLLATLVPPHAQHPQAFEVLPLVFDFLTLLDDWTARSELAFGHESNELICELAEHALVEVRL